MYNWLQPEMKLSYLINISTQYVYKLPNWILTVVSACPS